MALNYSTTLKNARLQKTIDAIDGGGAAGTLKIYTAGGALLLSTIPLARPSFATPSGGAMTLAGTPLTDTNAAATGVAALGRFYDSTGTLQVDGMTVGISGTDIIVATTTINAAD